MSAYDAIDVSQYPAPEVIEALDYELLLNSMQEQRVELMSTDNNAWVLLESDPAAKILQVVAYQVMLLRQRINDAAKALLLAYATDSDLDHIGATYYRLERDIIPATDTQQETIESDDRYRARLQLSPESYTTAGSTGSYTFHALNASLEIIDVDVHRPAAGTVLVTVLAEDMSAGLLNTVHIALNDEKVRPLCDTVVVQAATEQHYQITATLHPLDGPDAQIVFDAAEQAVNDYVTSRYRMGHDISRSGIFAALHQPGIHHVELSEPAADIVIEPGNVARCTAINLTLGEVSDE